MLDILLIYFPAEINLIDKEDEIKVSTSSGLTLLKKLPCGSFFLSLFRIGCFVIGSTNKIINTCIIIIC